MTNYAGKPSGASSRISQRNDKMAKIYMICSVRNAPESEREKIIAYAEGLEREGHKVRCPIRDTNQDDELGLRIVEEHEDDIIWADRIEILWNKKSEGSLWDAAQARMARRFMPEKKIVVVNLDDVEVDEHKTYNNVVLATHFGLKSNDGFEKLREKLAKAKAGAALCPPKATK